ncbi:MAG: exodeoxyribonuclease VII large subunit [Campylobacteraceae bacterium]|nr:exodeoxyribonuclease VII large subunit [Campylobacteraceae bacterium]MBT4179379.1 exodeoxyribonuclease VII large subunit [Campylobacteraceae bacterium]MBT5983384.1 exodeoxyribonuclease VII large subunit [Campylobacteraceae bacterium]MBT6107378.1 exodeoxyribonuclease VII large subunit [Campylobacteraceae bacterium]
MQHPISVSDLNNQIKGLLETTFSSTYVEGEISNLTYHNSGHIYFSIKDSKSTISCVMFAGNARYLKFQLEVGMKIIISGSITVYTPRGNYQLLCKKIDPSGVGSLALAYEQLKAKLQTKGYFSQDIKKVLPNYPKTICIVTSNTGAAIEDMKKIAQNRWPLTKLILIPTLVQGNGSQEDIVNSIQIADRLNVDIIIVGRGGGSIEDLWAFNEEIVADAIYNANTPIISAVGHESDFVISDFVADIRASTPSNAIEISLPDINEQQLYINELQNNLNHRFKTIIYNKEQQLVNLKQSFSQHSLENKFIFIQKQIDDVKQNFNHYFQQILNQKQSSINLLKQNFQANDPKNKNFGNMVQISKDGKLTTLENIDKGDNLHLQTSNLDVTVNVVSKEEI